MEQVIHFRSEDEAGDIPITIRAGTHRLRGVYYRSACGKASDKDALLTDDALEVTCEDCKHAAFLKKVGGLGL